MSLIKLVIADENQSYIKALAQYLHEEYGQAFEVKCFTQKAVVQEYLSRGDAVDILLIESALFNEAMSHCNVRAIMFLKDIQEQDPGENELYKYQKADSIVKRLLEVFDKISSHGAGIVRNNYHTKLASVYSPVGGAGKTSVAYNLAYQYAMQGQKVLLISLESYASLSLFKRNDTARGLMYLLYLVKNKVGNLQLKLNAMKAIDENTNIHYIERESNILEYKDIKLEDMELLMSFFREKSGYDAVIFDLDSTMNEMVLGAFKYSDVILNLRGDDPTSQRKYEDFNCQLPQINNLLKSDVSGRMVQVIIRLDEGMSQSNLQYKMNSFELCIPYISNSGLCQGSYFPELSYFKELYDVVNSRIYSQKVSQSL